MCAGNIETNEKEDWACRELENDTHKWQSKRGDVCNRDGDIRNRYVQNVA
jgi:hypothetical protein